MTESVRAGKAKKRPFATVQVHAIVSIILNTLKTHTVAGIPSPAAAHFLIHCCRVSIPFCSMPFPMLAPSVTRPVGASTTAVQINDLQNVLIIYTLKRLHATAINEFTKSESFCHHRHNQVF